MPIWAYGPVFYLIRTLTMTGIRPKFYENLLSAGIRLRPSVFDEVVESDPRSARTPAHETFPKDVWERLFWPNFCHPARILGRVSFGVFVGCVVAFAQPVANFALLVGQCFFRCTSVRRSNLLKRHLPPGSRNFCDSSSILRPSSGLPASIRTWPSI
jgi:hypothetical protein